MFAGLPLIGFRNFLLFHSIAELFSVAVAWATFMLFWNARRVIDNSSLTLIGIAYLFVGGIDLFHALSYKGMGLFQGYDANLPTQLWIAARYIESISLCVAFAYFGRKVNAGLALLVYTAVTALLAASIFTWKVFPDCFVEGAGLTAFKKASEYIVSLLFISTIALLIRRRRQMDRDILRLMIWSLAVRTGSELAFTFYISVYGFSNLLGHMLKIVSMYLMYKAIVETGIVAPYTLLFRELKQSEESLREERDKLREALGKVKTLSGLLPICASCKRIRDDKGYWNRIEIYLRQRSDAEFSHGICPECREKLYPSLSDK